MLPVRPTKVLMSGIKEGETIHFFNYYISLYFFIYYYIFFYIFFCYILLYILLFIHLFFTLKDISVKNGGLDLNIYSGHIQPLYTSNTCHWMFSMGSQRHKGIRNKILNINKLPVPILSNTPRLALEDMYNLPPNHILWIREWVLSLSRNRYALHSNWVVQSKAVSFVGLVKYWEKKAGKLTKDLEGTDRTKQITVSFFKRLEQTL